MQGSPATLQRTPHFRDYYRSSLATSAMNRDGTINAMRANA
jgi:hypothetical protein